MKRGGSESFSLLVHISPLIQELLHQPGKVSSNGPSQSLVFADLASGDSWLEALVG